MIPYSFIPGTKAKASEVNANFIALADTITKNKETAYDDILDVKELMKDKADKDELITNFTVSTAETDLNDYTTVGTYVFSSLYTPNNIPKGEAGILVVIGVDDSTIKQVWYCDGEYGEIFTRNYQDSEWSEWSSIVGEASLDTVGGYLRLANGLLIQWGIEATTKAIVYPIAYESFVCVLTTKSGFGSAYERSDTGFTAQSLTGFTLGTGGVFKSQNWLAIGY
jgi:hypothetical protein